MIALPATPATRARIVLHALAPADEALFVELYTDEATMRWIAPPLDPPRARRCFAAALRTRDAAAPPQLFAVIRVRASGAAIGLVGIAGFGEQRRSAEVGIVLRASMWQRGYGREALGAWIDQVFGQLSLARVCVQYARGHVALERLATGLGFATRGEGAADGASAARRIRWLDRGSWQSQRRIDQTRG